MNKKERNREVTRTHVYIRAHTHARIHTEKIQTHREYIEKKKNSRPRWRTSCIYASRETLYI